LNTFSFILFIYYYFLSLLFLIKFSFSPYDFVASVIGASFCVVFGGGDFDLDDDDDLDLLLLFRFGDALALEERLLPLFGLGLLFTGRLGER